MLRKPGSLTSGDSEAVRLVGPSAPATKGGRPLRSAYSSATSRAMRAAAIVELRDQRLHAVVGLRDGAFELNVLVSMMSAPASRYARWMPRDDSRLRQREQVVVALEIAASRGSARRESPPHRDVWRWIIVPIAPSSTRMRSSSSALEAARCVCGAASHRAARSRRAPPVREPQHPHAGARARAAD